MVLPGSLRGPNNYFPASRYVVPVFIAPSYLYPTAGSSVSVSVRSKIGDDPGKGREVENGALNTSIGLELYIKWQGTVTAWNIQWISKL